GGTADRNRSHWSTSKTPSYTKSVSWQHHQKQLIIAGVVTEVCVAFPALSAIEEGFDVFVVTDASGTFNEITRHSAWDRLSQAGAQLMTWFGVACELHRDWRNDIEGLATLFSNHIPDYRNLMTSYDTLTKQK
ncbi:isochorismatase family protein, partial [Escherichia coli]|uniref:isochorismatase family protein n=5 Tax=Escherichia coli TaxID=562 RepID=UPI001FCEDF38